MPRTGSWLTLRAAAAIGPVAFTSAAAAHDSLAMFDRAQIRTFTGVVANVDPGPDHPTIFFAMMNDRRDRVVRADEGGARHPARDGEPAGVLNRTRDNRGVLCKRPGRVCPAPGQHGDSVQGITLHGHDNQLPAPTELAP
jgi:hypothetical protein